MIYGYARVSTKGQTLEAQVRQLQRLGIRRIFKETASGNDRARPQLMRALESLQEGDCLTVTRLDRLARSTADFYDILAKISDAGAVFKSLSESWADTTTSQGRLMMAIFSGIAEFERDLINGRMAEGRAIAKANGQHMGRFPKLTPHQAREALARLQAGESARQIAKSYAVSHPTITRLRRVIP